MTIDPFVGLHVHNEYSFLDGRQTVAMQVARLLELNQTAGATTNHGECSDHVEFERECKKHGVKPIFGMEGYLVHDAEASRRNKDLSKGHITLLAKTQLGLKNIWKLSTTGYKQFYQKPMCDWRDYRKYSQGVVATDGCLLSWMAKAIIADDNAEIERLVQLYLDTYGDNFYMELHTWQIPQDPWGTPLSERATGLNADMTKVNQQKVEIAARHNIPLIVVNDAHYDVPDEARNHQLIWQMSTASIDKTKNNELAAGHMMGSIEIIEMMKNHGISEEVTIEAILNTRKIADSCEDVTTGIFEHRVHIPLLTGSEEGDTELFKAQSRDGYERKYVKTGKDTPETRKRDEYEEDQIISKRFAGYHVIVADYCKFAKGGPIPATVLGANGVPSPFTNKEPWLVGPTRGSGGGSIKNYCLDITEADPMFYGIPFERYIDPGRKSFPDIDLDFPQSKRQDMKAYAQWKYGHGNVASIGTFSKIGFKQAVRDIGRALGIPYPECSAISSLIEQVEKALKDELSEESGDDDSEITWEDIISEKATELLPWVQKYPLFFKHMQEIVGIKRQHSVHASGILISPIDLFEELPLRVNEKTGDMVTQFDMYTVEDLGFIKFDILGIRHLDTIMTTDKFVHGNHDPRRFYDMTPEDLSDPKTAELIASGETLGIFTIETPGMTATAKRMMPKNERDVSHLTSLQRPGVIKTGGVERFLRRLAGRERPKTPHPMVDDICKDTYGVFVYQDQVLEAVRRCAGYSYTESDRFRKILGKKKMDQMRAEKDMFLSRCLENEEFVQQSVYFSAEESAHKVWDEIEPAGTYAFNLAHALGYGLLSWWSAYQKANHYFEDAASLLITDKVERIPEYLREARIRGVKILPPNINKSVRKFAPVDGALIFGLDSIDKVGKVAVETILQHRAEREFKSLEDFFRRIPGDKVNKSHVVNLISIGAFDDFISEDLGEFGLDARNMLLQDYFEMRAAKDPKLRRTDKLVQHDYSSMLSVAALEFSLVKTYITNDPDDRYARMISEVCQRTMGDIQMVERGLDCYVGGKIVRYKTHKSSKPGRNLGRTMAFIDIEWRGNEFPVVAFFDSFEMWNSLLEIDAPVIMKVEKTDKGSLSMVDVIRLDWLLDGKEQ
ncbi:MAG TPA: DNA polymerase III subunit alpha [Candidatus Paceibacterota bacterium]